MKRHKKIFIFFISLIALTIAVFAVIYFVSTKEEKVFYSSNEFEEQLKSTATTLLVNDVAASAGYYTKYFGFSLYKRFPLEGRPTLAVLDLRGLYVMLQDKEIFYEERPTYIGGEIEPSFSLYIDVKNVQSLYDSLKDKLEIVQDYQQMFYGRYEFSVKDLDGYIVTFSGSR